jgi:hypothetical protein
MQALRTLFARIKTWIVGGFIVQYLSYYFDLALSERDLNTSLADCKL